MKLDFNPDVIPTARKVLLVEDSLVDRHLVAGILHSKPGWSIFFAGSGKEALKILNDSRPDLVLTDLYMPDMDGLELVTAVRASYPKVPIVLMTAHGNEELAIRVLQAGAASYVPKKTLARELHGTLEEVLSTVRFEKNQRLIRESLSYQELRFEIGNDMSSIAPLVSHIESLVSDMNSCEANAKMLVGVALHEAITNAILHGNLELKSGLRDIDEEIFYQAAEERRKKPPYASRRVAVTAILSRDEVRFTIRDEGPGFNPQYLPNPFEPENMDRISGRGMILIRTFMDQVEHNAKGNEVTLIKRKVGI